MPIWMRLLGRCSDNSGGSVFAVGVVIAFVFSCSNSLRASSLIRRVDDFLCFVLFYR
jgi:hypothetical protein